MRGTLVPDSACVTELVPSPNFDERAAGCGVDMVLLHYTGMDDDDEALRRLSDPDSKVSSHYLVREDGVVVQLVGESCRAWHAGAGSWHNVRDVNSSSIGIEIGNRGHNYPERDAVPPPYPGRQIEAVIALAADIVRRRGIAATRVLGHSDIAPQRKADPGEHFPWPRLFAAGLGLPIPLSRESRNPAPAEGVSSGAMVGEIQRKLAAAGYEIIVTNCFDSQTRNVIRAFQRHFHPVRVDGLADAGTLAALDELVKHL
ncbi:MAG: N-acetylmuramoyl-L-alanine amidase [Methylobacteriaceae bacterium]|jgi:N-acetylmuramoyl-L-alanine amidase|nr:N-acetylmuramoyl-L-alanine amidase [Methylobacteriaceae bacterium]